MKKLLIPVVIAVLAGVGGGSAFSMQKASKAFVADSIHRADSLAAHPPAQDSTLAEGHGGASDPDAHSADALAANDDRAPSTPADSIRAVEAARVTATSTGKNSPVKGAVVDTHGTDASNPGATAGHDADAKSTPAAPTKTSVTVDGNAKATTAAAANIVRSARNDAMSSALPEQRLAKIFAAMSAKDAAKVLDQMTEADVREILSLMNDRAAAAILVQFAPARAAAITKGVDKKVNKEPRNVP